MAMKARESSSRTVEESSEGGKNLCWSPILGSTGSMGEMANQGQKRFVAPRCHCGTYAILFQSSTAGNPNRLFFGCSYFKTASPHCKYFAWLDEYIVSCSYKADGKENGVVERLKTMEERLEALELKIAKQDIGKTVGGNTKCRSLTSFLIGIAVTVVISAIYSG
ncbi:uncharacterized protein LOC130947374 [Arachis stenosperma]|uniref:uncharacterized protein LOC130943777 n=1 Tax=Arachis stenosperma TaxID=217475 RepID=UPI0025AC6F8D|nr:uncharacterized protein LOC130943777 [Arachis stenosperma]XP_057732043.1 uncharacterized protein LOC130947374 [Arachis stenosperma]